MSSKFSIVRLNRMIDNLYTAAFERSIRKFNTLFRQVQQYPVLGAGPIGSSHGYISEVMKDRPTHYVRFENPGDNDTRDTTFYDLATPSVVWTDGNSSVVQVDGLLPDYGGYARFGDLVSAGAVTSGPLSDYTIECIIKMADSAVQTIYDTVVGGDGITVSVAVTTRRPTVVSEIDGTLSFTTVLAIGTTYHMAIVRDLGVGLATLYLDGTAVETLAISDTTATTDTSSQRIGSGTSTIDEVAIYKHALPAHRIAAHYAAYASGQATDPNKNVGMYIPPLARFYADLTIGGTQASRNDSAFAFATGITAQYSAEVLDESTMWGVIRLRPRWAFDNPPTTPTIFDWSDDANNRITLYYHATNDEWALTRLNGGSGAEVSIAGDHAAYEDLTIAFAITGTTVMLSLNGATWVSVANSDVPTLAATEFDMGNGDNPSNCDFHWVMFGVGSLSADDIATIHAFGAYDPSFEDIPDMIANEPSFIWPCQDETHIPAAVYGESVYE